MTKRRLSVPAAAVGHLGDVLARVRRMFDLDADPVAVESQLASDPLLWRQIRRDPGLRVPGAWDGFELTIRAVLGQQVSVKAATTIAGRIAARYGEKLRIEGDPDSQLNRLFPTPDRLARARFNNIGLVRSRATTIRSVATATIRGDLRFDGSQSPDKVRAALMSIKGIGDWTAQYVSMRALKDPDAFPGSDLGLISALAHPQRVTPKELTARAEHWRPWRAYAAMLLWGSLPGSGG